ncbi:uncharacterized protein CPUR_08743 [Claviceps purpurea 20.1]|uniref:Uncharacterized protein n=1 Tax=Claviceps purpurea (strain 20.1) TaxID=1111077 RepID=M1WDH5_CLAP2|nr:uncharacterized protein CPUR_08743 [Claviceps purpurea 20.1]
MEILDDENRPKLWVSLSAAVTFAAVEAGQTYS